ncbi:MAG: alpha/beta fold hydrolase [Planctomycetota bacterium]|nr:alpha/beta fold hydrolase [Planctomycetota bacterium]
MRSRFQGSVGIGLLASLAVFAMDGQAEAQGLAEQRYELARRLRHFEQSWDKHPDKARRLAALPSLKGAVRSFFSFRLGTAMRHLDEARLSLDSDSKSWSASLKAAQSAKFTLAQRITGTTATVQFQIARAYGGKAAFSKGLVFRATVRTRTQGKILWRLKRALPLTLGAKHKFKLGNLPEGDHVLRLVIFEEKKELGVHDQTLSVIKSLKSRSEALKAATARLGKGTDKASLALQLALIKSLQAGKTQETDIPASLFMKRMEALITPGTKVLTSGQHWMSLIKKGSSPQVVRLQIPENQTKSVPLVLALHGAGGSENMFFDTYGAGAIARLCEQRGWILVAPRLGFGRRVNLDQILSGLKGRANIDNRQIFVVGHSMGAGVACQLLSSSPKAIKAAALISGGRGLKASDDLLNIAMYFAAGSEDFGRSSTKGSYSSIKGKNPRRCLYEEFENIEHLVIVQEALPKAFKFFDMEFQAKSLRGNKASKKSRKARLY